MTSGKPVYAKDSLLLAVHPYLAVKEIEKKFTPLVEYLAQKTGKKIIIRVGSNYQEHIRFIGTDKVDIAYMGPASYVSMTKEYGKKPVLARLEVNGQAFFQGNIIVRKNSNIKTIQDLKGKRIAYGDPNSTMSYIVPHHMLHKAGVYAKHPSTHDFLYSHNNVAMAVLSGDFDAGAVKPAVFKKFESKGLRTLVLTPKISEHLFVARTDLPENEITVIRNAFLDMRNSDEGLAAMRAIKKNITGLVKVSDHHYDNLRVIINETDNFNK